MTPAPVHGVRREEKCGVNRTSDVVVSGVQ